MTCGPFAARLDAATPERGRHRHLVRYQRGKVGLGTQIHFNGLDEFIQPAKSFKFVAAIHLCRVQRSPQHIDRLIVGFQRDRKRVSVFPPKRE